jgi:hypothetical protein
MVPSSLTLQRLYSNAFSAAPFSGANELPFLLFTYLNCPILCKQVLRKHGGLFSPQTLSVIFKGVLFPMIDSAKTDATSQVGAMCRALCIVTC